MVKKTEVIDILTELNSFEDVLACMLVRKGFEGISAKNIKIKNAVLIDIIHQTTNELFFFIEKFYGFKLERLSFELGEYIILIAPVSKKSALITVIPSFANLGLIDIELENTKRKILSLQKNND